MRINLLNRPAQSCPSPGRRRFIKLAFAGSATAYLALTTGLLIKRAYSPSRELRPLSAWQTNNPDIAKWLKIIKEKESSVAFSFLEDVPGGLAYFRPIIQEGSYMQYYFACQALAFSAEPEANQVVQDMILQSSYPWEKALGLVILGQRAKDKQSPQQEAIKTTQQYLDAKDPMIRLGAISVLIQLLDEAQLARVCSGTRSQYEYQRFLPYKDSVGFFARPIIDDFQTAFFRYCNFMHEIVLAAQQSSDDNFVVWDIGCSFGSSTRGLLLALQDTSDMQVIGTDINPYVLLYAQRGRYLLEQKPLVGSMLFFDNSYKKGNATEIAHYLSYADKHQLDRVGFIQPFLTIEEGYLGNTYIFNRDDRISFGFDDITSTFSPVEDNSINIAVYTNVHYQLGSEGKIRAVKKIHQKLKPGGKVFFINSGKYPLQDILLFASVFGSPVKKARGGGGGIFVKRED